ncbi:hypothetical protein SK128_023570, partial [Halocaridina rubra]
NIEYLYKHVQMRYRIRNGLDCRTYSADSTTTEDEDESFSCNASMLSDTTLSEREEVFDVFGDI